MNTNNLQIESSSNSNSNRAETISSSSVTQHGFSIINEKLRSILMHPIGMLLAALLNDAPRPNIQSEEFWSLVNTDQNGTFLTYIADRADRNYVFAAAILKWDGRKETELTTTIHSYIESLSARGRIDGYGDETGNSLLFEREVNTATGRVPKGSGFMDFVVSEHNNNTTTNATKRSIVGIVEVGIEHAKWWRKTDQILKYVESIRSSAEADNSRFSFDQPILLTVITVSKNGSDDPVTVSCGSAKPTDDVSDQTKKRKKATKNIEVTIADFEVQRKKVEALYTIVTGSEDRNTNVTGSEDRNTNVTVQFGVFLCSPKGSEDYRIALLCRKKTTCLKEASTHFGKILYASKVCAQLRKLLATATNTYGYRYLGPNCCRIENFVRIFAHTT